MGATAVDSTDTNGKRGGLYALSESSPVRLGLAIACTGGCMTLAWQVATIRSDLKDQMDQRYVSKELFSARMDEMTRTLTELKTEIRSLQEIVREASPNVR